ncbi:GNAT family N-acetyltransferase [Luteibacter sp. 9133]|uniref:GNAT family N-acetyltransferase n=1 Tax=Luteibacter sp. 9133 TaxID=1500891 RepID=UPI00068DAD4F|nr:GNAT family N-acetyltransferase [Luteibacter sp. 9133]
MPPAFTVSVPRLQTDRLMLREYRPGDFDAFAAHLADPESVSHLTVRDRASSWRIFGSHAGLWLLAGAGWWAIESRETGELVGNVGAFFRDGSKVMEVGWNTYREAWGKGFASEAAACALAYAFDVRREPKVHAIISPSNVSSIKVAQRIGLVDEGEVAFEGKLERSYARYRESA